MIISSAIKTIDGEVVKGFRHGHAFLLTHQKGKTYKGATQGFVTDEGKFLNRQEALRHAVRCGQLPGRQYRTLYSETIWPHDLPEWGTRPPLWMLWKRVTNG